MPLHFLQCKVVRKEMMGMTNAKVLILPNFQQS